MKCRLYRGPFNGKIIDVDPHRVYWGVEIAKPVKFNAHDFANQSLADPNASITIERVRYVMKRMSVTIDGTHYSAPAMHPDGSVYLEYDKPRRGKK